MNAEFTGALKGTLLGAFRGSIRGFLIVGAIAAAAALVAPAAAVPLSYIGLSALITGASYGLFGAVGGALVNGVYGGVNGAIQGGIDHTIEQDLGDNRTDIKKREMSRTDDMIEREKQDYDVLARGPYSQPDGYELAVQRLAAQRQNDASQGYSR